MLVGLGNPGLKYKKSRHNIGFMVIDEFVRTHKAQFTAKSKNYKITNTKLNGGQNVVLAKPRTFMNRSGEAVAELVREFKVPHNKLLIILDDFNLPFGKLRFRSEGSTGGHNGLKSIIDQLQSTAFPRLRIGIGQEFSEDPINFVLGKFNKEEKKLLPEIIKRSADACLFFVKNGISKTMNKYN